MSYNDGCIHNDFYEDKENLANVAEEFSEGNPLLASTLLKLWKNGIRTNGCCNGHENNPISYLSIVISKESRALINIICNNLESFENASIDIVHDGMNNIDTFIINMPSEIRDEVLNFISNNISKVLNVEKNNRILYSQLFIDMAVKYGLSMRYAITHDGQQAVAIHNNYALVVFNNDMPHLHEATESLINEGGFKMVPYQCTDEEIEEFLGLLYANVSFNHKNQAMR